MRCRLSRVGVASLCLAGLLFCLAGQEQHHRPALSVRAEAEVTSPTLTYINRPLDLSTDAGVKARLRSVESACASQPEGDTSNILVYERKPLLRMSYCVVPKAGCTFWIRIFRFLNNDTAGLPAKTPFDIDRMTAHDSSRRAMKMYRLQSPDDRTFLEGSTRFMFARDPFARVWSAYIDKLLLPNMWDSVGKVIASRRPNATATSLLCGNDVTFAEFVAHIVDQSEGRGGATLNGHWRPVQYVCDPCKFRPHFLGKQETFMADAESILQRLGLQSLLNGYDDAAHRRDEISILADFNFALLHTLKPECASPQSLARLLWAAFQLNGHLSPQRDAGVLGKTALSGAAFKDLVFRGQEMDWEEGLPAGAVQRRRSLAQAYRALPRQLLQRFLDVYHMDFLYFGYDQRPKDIFG